MQPRPLRLTPARAQPILPHSRPHSACYKPTPNSALNAAHTSGGTSVVAAS